MNRFTTLYVHLDQATGSKAREAVLNEYFASASSKEATWAIYILNGGKINTGKYRVASTAELRAWVSELTRLPLWLVEDSYRQVGDLAETLALLVAPFRKSYSRITTVNSNGRRLPRAPLSISGSKVFCCR